MEIDEILKLKKLYELKKVERLAFVGKRHESSAEHTWSCLMLADFLLDRIKQKIDRLKVYELLMYHDIVEIESGDTPFHPEYNRENQKEKEKVAAEKLSKNFPSKTRDKFLELFNEFEEEKTTEAKFAKAVDALDAIIHEIDYKEDWKGWTAKFVKEHKQKYFEDFPELDKTFHEIMDWLEKEGYFSQ